MYIYIHIYLNANWLNVSCPVCKAPMWPFIIELPQASMPICDITKGRLDFGLASWRLVLLLSLEKNDEINFSVTWN